MGLRGQMQNMRGKAAVYINEEYGCAVGFPGRNDHHETRRSPPMTSSRRPVAAPGLISRAVRPSRKVTRPRNEAARLPNKAVGRG